MGSWTLGRVGLDVVANSVDAPATWDVSGDDIRFTGVLRASSVTDANYLRVQLNGLVDNVDEPFVPFTWSEDTSWDGFVRVTGVKVGTVPLSLTAGWFPFEVSMTRLKHAAHAPQVESRLAGALRGTTTGIVKASTVPWWATPTAATMDFVPDTSSATRTTETGTVKVQYTADGSVLYDAAPAWHCAPGDWYDGSCRIEYPSGGSDYRALTGRQIVNLPTLFRLNNGLVRVTYGGGDGLISVQHYVGGSWITAKVYKLTVGSSPSTIGQLCTVTIMRNSPECAAVRLGFEYATAYPVQVNIDLSLRRGALWVDGLMTPGLDAYCGIYRNTAEAASGHTGGVHATAADAAGGKFLLNSVASTGTRVNDLTQGGFYVGANDPMPFQVGYEPSGASGPDTFTNQTYSWFAATTERVTLNQR